MCTTVLCRRNNIMICRYVRVPSPVVFFFLTASVAWARRRVVAVTLPARLSENKSLVKVGQRKGTFFFFYARVCTIGQHAHAFIKANTSCGQKTPTQEPFNGSFRRGGKWKHRRKLAAQRGKEEAFCVVCFKNTRRRTKNKSVRFKRIRGPVSRLLDGPESVTRASAPESPDARPRPVSLLWVESRRQNNTEPDGEASESSACSQNKQKLIETKLGIHRWHHTHFFPPVFLEMQTSWGRGSVWSPWTPEGGDFGGRSLVFDARPSKCVTHCRAFQGKKLLIRSHYFIITNWY